MTEVREFLVTNTNVTSRVEKKYVNRKGLLQPALLVTPVTLGSYASIWGQEVCPAVLLVTTENC